MNARVHGKWLHATLGLAATAFALPAFAQTAVNPQYTYLTFEIGRASCRERVYVLV